MRGLIKTDLAFPNLWRNCVGAWYPSVDRSRSTILTDFSPYRNHGAFQSGISPTTAWVPSSGYMSIKFPNANNGWIIAENTSLANLSVSSIACWFSFTTYKIDNTLISISPTSYSASQLDIYPGDTSGGNGLRITWGGNQVNRNDSYPLNDGQMHSLVLVNESATSHSVYIDGTLSDTFTSSLSFISTTSKIYIGGASWGSGSEGNYSLGETRLYNRALTQSEIKLLSLRRGIAYETKRQSRGKAAAGAATNRRRRLLTAG